MMKDRYEALLDTVYELEGLVHLAIVRGEDFPKRIASLIREKVERIRTMDERLHGALLEDPTDSSEPTESSDPSDTSDSSGSSGSSGSPEPSGSPELSDPSDNSEEEDDLEEYVFEEDDEEEEDDQEDEEEEEVEDEAETEAEEEAVRRKPVFSINDRFLFIREIFGGDFKAFEREMNRLPRFDSYDEAEQYFIEEYSLDPEDPSVQNFFGILARYYQS